jgi:hypothetical protein
VQPPKKGLYGKKSRTSLKKRKKEENRKNWRQKNEGRTERLKAFIHDKETKRRRKLSLKMEYERLVDKSYAKKKQRGSPNSYIEKIPALTSGTATTDKNKEIHASMSRTAAPDKNEEIPASTLGTDRNIEQIPASMTHQTDLFAGITPEVQHAIDAMGEEELAQVISFLNKQRCLLVVLSALKTYQRIKNQEFRWRFELGKPLVKLELVNKLPIKMRRFHDWYLKKSAEGLEMFGMLVSRGGPHMYAWVFS